MDAPSAGGQPNPPPPPPPPPPPLPETGSDAEPQELEEEAKELPGEEAAAEEAFLLAPPPEGAANNMASSPPDGDGGGGEAGGEPIVPPRPPTPPTPQHQSSTADTEADGDEQPPPPPPPPREPTGAGQPQPPGAPASKPPEPTPQQRPQQEGDAAKETSSPAHGEDGAKQKTASSSRWRSKIRPVVWVYNLLRHKRAPPPDGDGGGGGDREPEAVGGEPIIPPQRQSSTAAMEADGDGKPPPPPPRALPATGAGQTQPPGAPASKPPEPAPQKRQQQEGVAAKETSSAAHGGDGGRKKTASSRWSRVRAVVWIYTLFRRKRPSPPTPSGKDDGGGAGAPDEGEEGKREGGMTGKDSKGKDDKTPEVKQLEEEKKEKATGTAEEERRKERWTNLREPQLQKILEEAFTKLLAGEFDQLKEQWRCCLVTFAAFPVDHRVKKQAVTYWWAAQFGLPHHLRDGETAPLGAEEIFRELCGRGFLEPIKNRCSKASHGCRVNPLVHWMVKRKAREEGSLVDLDERGEPADQQPKSAVLCLTASNRDRLQSIARSSEPPLFLEKKKSGLQRKKPKQATTLSPPDQAKEQQNGKTLSEFKNKRVILNINAHVYCLPDSLLLFLSDNLVVLQLGRWWNSDNDTYMEVERLEKLSAIGNLKNLRYLGMCGLSKLTELPKEVGKLLKLEVLDVRGCQNLTCVSSSSNLRQLTHLDLTECYMLEQIRREITFLSELQVFKGFVFSTDAEGYWNKMCRLQDLGGSMKKLHKLSINVTTDANVDKNEMAQLRFLDALKSLTITWGELPSVLTSAGRSKQKDQLLDKWTSLVLPPNLEKLDVRCYPKKEIPSEWFKPKRRVTHEKLMKLYVRGGAVEKLDLPEDNKIEILRLRYLKEFNMKWSKMHDMMKNLRYVEFVVNDSKVMKSKKGKQQDANVELKPNIPEYILDEHGVWELDKLEPRQNKKDSGDPQGPTTEQPTNNNVETGGVVAYHNEDIPKTHDSKKAHEGKY